MFERLERTSTADACATRLRGAILRGDLAPGERLPAERELAASFGVNRGTLRAALQGLEHAGLLRVQHGSGYSVCDFLSNGGPGLVPALADLARESGDLSGVAADLLLVRRALATSLIERLGTQKIRRAAFRAIEDAVQAFSALAEATDRAPIAAVVEADICVVRALVAATGSAVLALFLNPIADILERLPELTEAMYASPSENAAAYRELVEALRHGPLPAALVREMLEARDVTTLARLRAAGRRAK